MPYLITKTNGAELTVIDDASLDSTTDLSLVGRNYSGYGASVNENFVKLLENFANTTQPAKPLQGQLWFNTTNKTVNVCYDGKNFRSLANISVQSTIPTSSTKGDLWWDTVTLQLKAFDGLSYQVIGPAVSTSAKSAWVPVDQRTSTGNPYSNPISKFVIGFDAVATISKSNDFTPYGDDLSPVSFPTIKKGITLLGASSDGSTKSSGYYFWGTAAESLKSDISTTATSVSVATTSTGTVYFVTFLSTSTGSAPLKTDSGITYDPFNNLLNATATAATYADLAERYAADANYDVGTVLVIGGTREVTVTNQRANVSVAGIVSQHPAYRMNSAAGTDDTHPYIALKGRVPCKVLGPVKKGDLLVTSSREGYAEPMKKDDPYIAVLAKAITGLDSDEGMIEVLI
jgi:hypothetical protein